MRRELFEVDNRRGNVPLNNRGLPSAQRRTARWCICACTAETLLLLIQLYLAFHYTGGQLSDARSYLDLASYCAQTKTWYPSAHNLHDTYIFGNGYVNLLAACMRIAPGLPWVVVLNILFMQGIVFLSAGIAYRLTDSAVCASLTSVFVCLMGGFWGEIVAARTELCFIMLSCLSLYLLFSSRWGFLFLGGVALSLANWVRPLLVVYLPAALLFFCLRNTDRKQIAAFLLGILLTAAVIGEGAYRQIGQFVFQAQTMGINMLMGANDDADGSYEATVFQEGKAGYVEPEERVNMTFDQIDALYKREAIAWILRHFPRFCSLAPAKLFYFLATDTYGGSAFFNGEVETDNLAYLLELKDILLGRGNRSFALGDAVVLYSQVSYTLLLLVYLIGVVHAFRKHSLRQTAHLHLIVLLACGVSVMTVGGARYHMPYLPIFCICAAIEAERFLSHR